MTIRELHDTTHHLVKIHISCGDFIKELDRSNDIEMCAYGKYQVARLEPADAGELVVYVKMIPATE